VTDASAATRAYLEACWLASKIFESRRYRNRQIKRAVVTESGYSFKPFDDTKSLFIHIPKCAGISVSTALYGNLSGGHTTLDEYIRIFEPRNILSYFKFTIVRNPWDRLVSAFHFLKGGGFGEADRAWAEAELGRHEDFDGFVRGWLNASNIWKWYHFRPQYHYMLEKHRVIELDFIGRFESLESDFAWIAERVGARCTLPSINAGRHEPYTEYYCAATRDIVASVYAKDIAVLGYTF
jgi:hypothetical protein